MASQYAAKGSCRGLGFQCFSTEDVLVFKLVFGVALICVDTALSLTLVSCLNSGNKFYEHIEPERSGCSSQRSARSKQTLRAERAHSWMPWKRDTFLVLFLSLFLSCTVCTAMTPTAEATRVCANRTLSGLLRRSVCHAVCPP